MLQFSLRSLSVFFTFIALLTFSASTFAVEGKVEKKKSKAKVSTSTKSTTSAKSTRNQKKQVEEQEHLQPTDEALAKFAQNLQNVLSEPRMGSVLENRFGPAIGPRIDQDQMRAYRIKKVKVPFPTAANLTDKQIKNIANTCKTGEKQVRAILFQEAKTNIGIIENAANTSEEINDELTDKFAEIEGGLDDDNTASPFPLEGDNANPHPRNVSSVMGRATIKDCVKGAAAMLTNPNITRDGDLSLVTTKGNRYSDKNKNFALIDFLDPSLASMKKAALRQRALSSLLQDLFSCSANMIENAWGGPGSGAAVYYGAYLLERVKRMASDINRSVSVEKIGAEHLADIRFLATACRQRISILKEDGQLEANGAPNKSRVETFLTFLKEAEWFEDGEPGISEEVRNLVDIGLNVFKNGSSLREAFAVGGAIGEAKPYHGFSNCFRPSILTYLEMAPFKIFRMRLQCVSPLGRVIEYRSKAKITFSPVIFNMGSTEMRKNMYIPIPYQTLNREFYEKYEMVEKLFGFMYGKNKLSLQLIDDEQQKIFEQNLKDVLSAEPGGGSVAAGAGLDGYFENLKSEAINGDRLMIINFFGKRAYSMRLKEFVELGFAPMNRRYLENMIRTTETENNIPKALGLDAFYLDPITY